VIESRAAHDPFLNRLLLFLIPNGGIQLAMAFALAAFPAVWAGPALGSIFALATPLGWAVPFALSGVLVLLGVRWPLLSYLGGIVAAGLWATWTAALAFYSVSQPRAWWVVLMAGFIAVKQLGLASLPVAERLDILGPFRRRG
jgi:uncharacterized membrane protein YkgB